MSPSFKTSFRRPWLVILGFFVLLLLVGMFVFRDYGTPYDEGTMDSLGRDSYNYVFKGAEWPENPAWRYHGTVVELPLSTIQQLFFNFDDATRVSERLYFRHFACFVFALFGLWMLYLIGKRVFKDSYWALLPCLLFVLTPRLFAHSFYNSRDIPELAFFTGSMYTLIRLLDQRTIKNALLHSLLTALALGIRMPAIIIPVITVLFFGIDLLQKKIEGKSLELKRTALLLGTYVIGLGVMLIAVWPFLWSNPVGHFVEAYRFMSTLSGTVSLFLGHSYAATPWNYIPVWMFITIPLAYTFFVCLELVGLGRSFIRHPQKILSEHRNQLLFLAWLVLPILAVIVTKAGVYTDWRHLYFVYPAFLLLAVLGLRTGLRWAQGIRWLTIVLWLILIVQMLSTGVWMIRNHPFENVYFSIPTRFIAGNFPLDEWALSYKQDIEYILVHDDHTIFTLYSDENVAFLNTYNFFPETLSKMMRVPGVDNAMYVVTRNPAMASGLTLLHPITVDGLLINGVYKGPVKKVNVNFETHVIEVE